MLDELARLRARDGGTLYLTDQPAHAARGGGGAGGEPAAGRHCSTGGRRRPAADNPYLGLLAHADRFVVTGDSVSMMVEVASLGRPLAIFPLPVGRGLADRARGALARLAGGSSAAAAHLLHRLGLAGYARDLSEIHRLLIERGLAVPLGEPFRPPAGPLADELRGWSEGSAPVPAAGYLRATGVEIPSIDGGTRKPDDAQTDDRGRLRPARVGGVRGPDPGGSEGRAPARRPGPARAPDEPGAWTYIAPGARLADYRRFILDPPRVFRGEGSGYGDLPDAEVQARSPRCSSTRRGPRWARRVLVVTQPARAWRLRFTLIAGRRRSPTCPGPTEIAHSTG